MTQKQTAAKKIKNFRKNFPKHKTDLFAFSSLYTEAQKTPNKKENKKMKKFTKQLLALLLAGTMIAALASCGNSEGESNGESSKKSSKTESGDKSDPGSGFWTDFGKDEPAPEPSEGLEFKIIDGICTVVGFGTCTDTEIVIPAEYEGNLVHKIGTSAFCKKYDVGTNEEYRAFTKIYLPDTIDHIEDGAFMGCDSLEEVHIYPTDYSNDITTIARYDIYVEGAAFRECTSLKYIDLSKICMSDDYIFSDCASFQEFTINEGRIYEGTTSVGRGLLHNCTSLKSLTIPASVTELPVNLCSGCTNLTDIYYNGTIEQWSDIIQNRENHFESMIESVHTWWDKTGEFTVHCTDGDIPKSDAVVNSTNCSLSGNFILQ